MNSDNTHFADLDEMKQQLLLLQKKLDTQVEINDKQLRRAIRSGMSSLLTRNSYGLLFCIVITPLMPYWIHELEQPLWMVIVTLLYMLICDAFQIVEFLHMRRTNSILASSLIEAQQRLISFKRYETKRLLYVAPVMIIGFLGIFLYSIHTNGMWGDTVMPFLPIAVGAVVGGVTGIAIGIIVFVRPQFRKIDEVTASIAEITE